MYCTKSCSYIAFDETRHIRQHPKGRWCLRPGCTAGVIHGWDDRRPKITCNSCRFKSCYICQVPWHKGIDCIDYAISQQDQGNIEALTKSFMSQKTKSCPTCGIATMVNKNEVHCGIISCECMPKLLHSM